MKTSLSGNSWSGSSWDGKSVYTKKTQEQNANGSYVTITADFRKYACVEDSIADHAAYLRGAMNGSRKRYEGLAGCMDYKKAVQIIKDGGYATSHTYVQNLCNIIERWNLTQYNAASGSTTISGWYRVRRSWQNASSQKGAFHDLSYYRMIGNPFPEQRLVSFQIQEALPIENGRVLDGTGSPTFALCRAEGSPSQNNPTPEEKADSGAM